MSHVITHPETFDVAKLRERIHARGSRDLGREVLLLLNTAEVMARTTHVNPDFVRTGLDEVDALHTFNPDRPDMSCPVCSSLSRFRFPSV